MRFGQKFVLGIALLTILTGVGCKKRKPSIPAKSQPPTLEQPTIPPVATQPAPTPPTVTPEPAQPAPTETAPATTKNRTHIRRRKPAVPAQAATSTPTAKPAPAKPSDKPDSDSGNISAEVPQNAANQRRLQTENLLQAAEGNLKRVNRTLSDGEDSMQRQVRNFITQARLAMQDGDLERAFNLATKANLLSQELVK